MSETKEIVEAIKNLSWQLVPDDQVCEECEKLAGLIKQPSAWGQFFEDQISLQSEDADFDWRPQHVREWAAEQMEVA